MSKNNSEVPIPERTFTVEFYVGLFAIVGLLCLAYLAMNIAGIRLFKTGMYEVQAEFDDVSGLELGAPVEIAGVSVGEVRAINLNATRALVVMELNNAAKLRDDDIATIRTKGIIGDKYVKVVPGGSEEAIPPGGKITDTESVMDFESIIGKIIHRLD